MARSWILWGEGPQPGGNNPSNIIRVFMTPSNLIYILCIVLHIIPIICNIHVYSYMYVYISETRSRRVLV